MRALVAPLLGLALLAGCEDGDGVIVPGEFSGTVRLDFAGDDRSGTFEATGEIDREGESIAFGTWAAGSSDSRGTLVAGFRGESDPVGDLFLLTLVNVTEPGTYQINTTSGDCDSADPQNCNTAVLAFEVDVDALEDGDVEGQAEAAYVLLSGEVTIDSASSEEERITGSFSGTAALATDSSRTLTITNGQFDVPLLLVPIVF